MLTEQAIDVLTRALRVLEDDGRKFSRMWFALSMAITSLKRDQERRK